MRIRSFFSCRPTNFSWRGSPGVGLESSYSSQGFERCAELLPHVRAQAPEPDSDVEPSRPSALERAWQRFVLLLS